MEILEFIKGREVLFIAIIFIIAMTLYGHNRGFVKMALSFASVIIALVVVNAATPYVSEFVSESPYISGYVQEKMRELVTNEEESSEEEPDPDRDKETLSDGILLPESLREGIGEGIYEGLGIDELTDQIAGSLSKMIIKAIVFVLLFIIVSIALRVLIRLLSLVTNLPVICGMNQLMGAGIGFAEAIFYIWIFMLVMSWLPLGDHFSLIMSQIRESDFLNYLYKNNLISVFFFFFFGL